MFAVVSCVCRRHGTRIEVIRGQVPGGTRNGRAPAGRWLAGAGLTLVVLGAAACSGTPSGGTGGR
jgi:hypothetical protein